VGDHIAGLIGGLLAGAAIKLADTRRVPGVGRPVPALGFVACLLLSILAVAASLAIAGNTTAGIV
jgi:hypothetical protein